MTTRKSTKDTVTEGARKVADQFNEEFNQATKSAERLQQSLSDSARDIWLAGLGLFSTLEEEGEKMFTGFVEKGKDLEKKGETVEKRAKERIESFQTFFTERTDQITKEFQEKLNNSVPTVIEEKFQQALETFGVSSRNEVNKLNDKVDKLTNAVEQLTKKLSENGKKSSSTK
ncbi:MAG: phasin family protein [Calditrichaeota bacterium]|nr:phasin family protein [Calditrichota bacterium]MCB0269177.1 phasin family protein [Calditrichota bacterium]MCB0286325.1 phasin family protein [Calditrichota bacterium]MCB0301780.1 phasin family protein [Calditrichota bacterium]MCB9066969.1 phasin family protein [Calditrichia bacterium]